MLDFITGKIISLMTMIVGRYIAASPEIDSLILIMQVEHYKNFSYLNMDVMAQLPVL